MFSVRDIQARVAALGFSPGAIDGVMGPKTRGATQAAMTSRRVLRAADLFHPSGVHRIHWHWTAGAYGDIALERRAYNGLIDRDGSRIDGDFRFEAQGRYQVGQAASHSLNANSGAGGLACDAMAGAQEVPFKPGSAPLTWPMIEEMCRWTAELCEDFDIPISPWSTLSHAEIQANLGIRQRSKWDITWLPDMDQPGSASEVGNRLRGMTAEMLQDVRRAA